jgi:hypothetical protein
MRSVEECPRIRQILCAEPSENNLYVSEEVGNARPMLIPVKMNAHSGHRERVFRASRSLSGAERRRQLVSSSSSGRRPHHLTGVVLRQTLLK